MITSGASVNFNSPASDLLHRNIAIKLPALLSATRFQGSRSRSRQTRLAIQPQRPSSLPATPSPEQLPKSFFLRFAQSKVVDMLAVGPLVR